jgi:NADPH:quinone reductase-like Zn-dependent oxidoreductase
MKTIIINEFGGVDKLQPSEQPIPVIKDSEVLVHIKAFSINPVDVKTRAGKGIAGRLKDVSPIILGWDISGIVTQVGTEVTNLEVGDEVFGMIEFPGLGKAYAEYVAAPADQLAIKPDNITHEEAAAATLAALTALEALIDYLKAQPGDKVLIHAAAGGVGHYAVQLAKLLGAHVIGTSSAPNRDFVLNLGADEHVDYQAQPLSEVISNVDKVLDTVGGENIDLSLEVMKPGGIIVSIPSGKNDQVEEKAAAKGMTGIAMLVKTSGQNMQKLSELLHAGKLKSHVSKTFAFTEIQEAHLQVETGKTVGKVVVTTV